jgi:putative ABC transport system permease protein
VVLASLGLLGLAASIAERRTREIGIRKALGADTGNIIRLLLRQFAKPVLWANMIAWPVTAYAMHRWLHGFAYHVDLAVWLFPAAAALALMIALLTVSTHSILIARAKPVAALRYE